MAANAIDEAKLEEFMGRAVGDMSAAMSAPLTMLGEKLGLYKAMAGGGPLTSARWPSEPVRRALVREWLRQPDRRRLRRVRLRETTSYELPAEQAMALADEDSPVYLAGAFDIVASVWADEDKLIEAFKTGDGLGWHEHDHAPVPRHRALLPARLPGHLVAEWIPALDGVRGEARGGARRSPTSAAATARRRSSWPRRSRNPSSSASTTTTARSSVRVSCAEEAGVGDRVSFEVASAQDFRAATSTSSASSTACTTWATRWARLGARRRGAEPDGTYMIVEPYANDDPRGEPQPGRPDVLRGLDDDLHAGSLVTGGRARARRAGGGSRLAAGHQGGWLHAASAARPRRRSTW